MRQQGNGLCRSFDPEMGTTARVLWVAMPELLHVGAVVVTVAVMVGIMGNTLFGFRAQAVSSLTCRPLLPCPTPAQSQLQPLLRAQLPSRASR